MSEQLRYLGVWLLLGVCVAVFWVLMVWGFMQVTS